MKKRIIYFFLIFITYFTVESYSSYQDNLKEQKSDFEINSFINNSQEYITDDFFSKDDLNQIFESAVEGKVNNKNILKNLLKLFGKELKNIFTNIAVILAIIVIHGILKSISDNLENNNISKLIYYVQFILIVTIIMENFVQIISLIKETIVNMVGFINLLIPILTSLMIFTGSIATTSTLEPIIFFGVNIIADLIQNLLLPVVLVIASFCIVSKISDKVQIYKLTKYLKSGVIWILGIVLTVFVSVISLEGNLASSVDGISAKTTKAVVSSAIPIVGKILGDAVDSVLGCGVILKNSVGIVGVIIIVGICVVPILKLAITTIGYKLLARSM
ncbi:MAG: stage III sporulation protein AE [Clostridia bacterium]|nr:stage III sporulation protein AE [Clostridia bacterium]